MMVDIAELKKIEIFEGLKESQFSILQSYCEKESYKKEEKLFTEGEKATHLWILLDGEIDMRFEMPDHRKTSSNLRVAAVDKVIKKTKIISFSCFDPPYKMHLSAYCISDQCNVVKIKEQDMESIFEKDFNMGYHVLLHLISAASYAFDNLEDEIAKQIGKDLFLER